jgi:hypothetical protein
MWYNVGLDWLPIWRGLFVFLMNGDPYSSPGFFYPVNFTLIFAPFALLPVLTGYLLLTLLTVALCVRAYGKRFAYGLLFAPVAFGLVVGNVDLLFVALAAFVKPTRKGAFIAAFLTLKPQLALILLPFVLGQILRENKGILVSFLAYTALLWGVPTLLFPDLTRQWLTGVLSGAYGHAGVNSAGLWSFGLPVALTAALCALVIAVSRWSNEKAARIAMMLISPLGQWNGLVALLDTAPLWVLAISGAIAVYGNGTTNRPYWFTIVPIAAFCYTLWRTKEQYHFVRYVFRRDGQPLVRVSASGGVPLSRANLAQPTRDTSTSEPLKGGF